jgi:transposase
MKKNDARKLDHKTLEELRIRVVKRVQEGESPEVLAKVLGLDRTTVYGWLRIPTKPAMHSNLKPATYTDLKPATVPI